MIRTASLARNIGALLILMALAMRVAVPSGWMPSADKAFALTVCTGMDVQTVWLDKQGNLHKDDPSAGKAVDHAPCAFTGTVLAADVPHQLPLSGIVASAADIPALPFSRSSVGLGLAAPPPHAIGPPSFI